VLTVITGPMFSGKTTRLLSLVSSYHHAGQTACIYKPSNDDRYSDVHVRTHDGQERMGYVCDKDHPEFIYKWSKDFANLMPSENFTPPTIFGIDEAQFFELDGLIEVVCRMLYRWHDDFPSQPRLIISGLSQDSNGEPFGAMPHLLAIADEIIHLKAVCAAAKKLNSATRTYRKDKTNTNKVAVGGAEMYEPRSFDEWLKK